MRTLYIDGCNKYEQFFIDNGTPHNAKHMLASIHLEGKPLQWNRGYLKARNKLDAS